MEKIDPYEKYNSSKYAHYRQVRIGGADIQEVNTGNGKKTRVNPKMEKRVIPFEEIKSLRLDDYGTTLPQLDTEDYTIVANYLLDFWGAVIGDAVQVYIHLKRYAYGKKDFCFPDIEMIALKMNKSVNTVKKYLDVLEEHHFIAKFNRYDITDNNREVSPFFKIRRQIPLLTPNMYDSLHPKIKKLHDEFTEEYRIESLDNSLTEKQAVVNEMVVGREIIANKETRKKIQAVIDEHNAVEYVMKNIDVDSQLATMEVRKVLEDKISKPSFDTWIKNLVFIKSSSHYWIVACPNEFVRDWVKERYDSLIKEELSNANMINQDDEMDYRLVEDVIDKMFRKNKA
jgi:DnaA N-terminal domain/Helix-turn-helix domain